MVFVETRPCRVRLEYVIGSIRILPVEFHVHNRERDLWVRLLPKQA